MDRPINAPKGPARGRPFSRGNSGRKPGSKNHATVVTAALLEGDTQELLGKAVELAKAGNVVMLKFLLARILPRERLIKLDLPRMEPTTRSRPSVALWAPCRRGGSVQARQRQWLR